MRLTIVGTGNLVDSPHFQSEITQTLQEFSAETVTLAPRSRFATAVQEIAKQSGISAHCMNHPKSTWLGKCPTNLRKQRIRQLRALFLVERCDHLVIYRSSPKSTIHRHLLERAQVTGTPVTQKFFNI